MFLTLQWIEKFYQIYQRRGFVILREKNIQFTPKLFLATLLRIYKISLWEWIERKYFIDLTAEERELTKKGFSYLEAQDLFSLEFSQWFRDNLLCRDYTQERYIALAFEFHQLKEQLKKQIQIPLLDVLKKLCMEIEEKLEEKSEIPNYQVKRLQRIYRFFKRVEEFLPSKSEDLVKRAEALLIKLNGEELMGVEPFLKERKVELEKVFEREVEKLIELCRG